jgi:hypothetical protein
MARIKSTWTLLSATAIIILINCLSLSSARNLDSNELSVGVWDVTMRCRRSSFTSEVFPPRVAREETSRQQRQRPWLPSWGGGDKSQLFDCQLSLFSNGTFALQPRDEKSWTNLAGATNGGKDEPVTEQSHPSHPPPYLAVHGRWKVQSNPYCVTDRSYDEVTLASVPRIQTRVTPTNTNTNANAEQYSPADKKVQGQGQGQIHDQQTQQRRLRLLMQCRMSGHYTNGGLARRLLGSDSYARGRISRGVILSQDEQQQLTLAAQPDSKPWWQSHNKVVASFSARRHIPPGFMSMDEDDLLDDSEYVS